MPSGGMLCRCGGMPRRSGGIPCSADVDAFDGIIADELAREGWGGSEQRSYEVACACADEAGVLLAPEFFACRARRLSGRNGLACR